MYRAVYIYSRSSSTELNVQSCLYIQQFKQYGVKCIELFICSRSSSTELNVQSCLYIQPFKQYGVKCTELFIYTAVQAVRS